MFHSPAWINVLDDTYGFAIRANLAIETSGSAVAGLVYAEIDDFMDPRLVSLPFSDFCDPLARDRAAWEVIVRDLFGRERRMSLRSLHNEVAVADERFEVSDELGWHGIDIARDPDQIWTEFSGSARRAIRKATADGLEIREAEDTGDLREFFELHLRVRKYKYGLLAQPYRFFESIWERFIERDAGTLLLALHEGRVIGGVMYLEWKDTLYYKFNASEPASLQVRPNDALLWAGVRHGYERGLRLLDFGVSDLNQEGLLRYKRKYSSEEGRVRVLSYAPEGFPTVSDRRARSVLSDLTKLLVSPDVPDRVTERAGDKLYRFFI